MFTSEAPLVELRLSAR